MFFFTKQTKLTFIPFIKFYRFPCLFIYFIFLMFISNLNIFSQDQPLETDIGATVTPVIHLSIGGGSNPFGKNTVFTGNGIQFRSVNFLHPELVTNGDAYRVGSNLRLEAVLNVGVDFSGVSGVKLFLGRVDISSNPFAKTHFSLSLNRSDVIQEIFTIPRQNEIKQFDEPKSIQLRLLFDIKPQQQGEIFDRYELTAKAL